MSSYFLLSTLSVSGDAWWATPAPVAVGGGALRLEALLWTLLVLAAVWAAFVLTLLLLGRGRLAAAAARFIPDLTVLFGRLLGDRRVPRRSKLAVALTLAYLAFPLDVVPDFIPVAGQLDDAFIVALVLRHLLRRAGPDLVQDHWPGRPEGLRLVLQLAGRGAGATNEDLPGG